MKTVKLVFSSSARVQKSSSTFMFIASRRTTTPRKRILPQSSWLVGQEKSIPFIIPYTLCTGGFNFSDVNDDTLKRLLPKHSIVRVFKGENECYSYHARRILNNVLRLLRGDIILHVQSTTCNNGVSIVTFGAIKDLVYYYLSSVTTSSNPNNEIKSYCKNLIAALGSVDVNVSHVLNYSSFDTYRHLSIDGISQLPAIQKSISLIRDKACVYSIMPLVGDGEVQASVINTRQTIYNRLTNNSYRRVKELTESLDQLKWRTDYCITNLLDIWQNYIKIGSIVASETDLLDYFVYEILKTPENDILFTSVYLLVDYPLEKDLKKLPNEIRGIFKPLSIFGIMKNTFARMNIEMSDEILRTFIAKRNVFNVLRSTETDRNYSMRTRGFFGRSMDIFREIGGDFIKPLQEFLSHVETIHYFRPTMNPRVVSSFTNVFSGYVDLKSQPEASKLFIQNHIDHQPHMDDRSSFTSQLSYNLLYPPVGRQYLLKKSTVKTNYLAAVNFILGNDENMIFTKMEYIFPPNLEGVETTANVSFNSDDILTNLAFSIERMQSPDF